MTHFKIDPNSTETTAKMRKTSLATEERISSVSTESTETYSEINLLYEPEVLRNSVIAYLEDTFSEDSIKASEGFNTSYITTQDRAIDDNLAPTHQTAQREYEFSLEQSQRLFDKMQGFVELSIDETKPAMSEKKLESENFCHSEEETHSYSSSSHEDTATQISLFTKLADCTQHRSTVNVFVVVLQVNPIKEMKINSGFSCGQFVKVASVLVGDPTKEYFKLTFWRKTAEWVNSLKEGDVLVVKRLKVEKWNQEFYGQSGYGTTLVNLQRDKGCRVPAQWLTIVGQTEAKSLLKWLKRKHSYLMSRQTLACEDVKLQTSRQFKANTLVHYRGKIVKVLTYGKSNGKYEFEKRKMNKILAVALDLESSDEVPICLWGRQAGWEFELKSKIGKIWCFTFLRVECNSLHGEHFLHTTPRSTKKLQQEETSFFANLTPCIAQEDCPTFSTIYELLQANLNGKAAICAEVTRIQCTEANSSQTISKASDMFAMQCFFRNLVYLGCKSCFRALKKDHNDIYMHCSYCIERHNSSYSYGVAYFFKQCWVYLSDESGTLFGTSSHVATVKFLTRPEDALNDDISKLFERIQRIFHSDNVNVVLRCETVLDENDFKKSQNFELLDLQVQKT
ncbi:shieldin complex subunit 2-like [Dendronephthya gigantea]|uniref:shieldin complex subunit 2-like n=1 Tax=Dendronephthya gigantea TaxID=151771 RepID=UPI00106C2B89|nr:shieldin complex subunit 2-like [Dendronephthya gigantea]